MLPTELLQPSALARTCLALAACGASLLSAVPAYAQYDQVEGPGGPVVSVPQITVRRAEVPASERAQLVARRIPSDRAAAPQRPAAVDLPRLPRTQGTARSTSTPSYNGG